MVVAALRGLSVAEAPAGSGGGADVACTAAADAKARMLTQAPPPRGADDPEPATVDFGTEGPLALSGLCTAPGTKKSSNSGPEPVSACFWRVEEVPPQQQKTKPRFHVEF